MSNVLSKLYYDEGSPSGYSSVKTLYEAAKKESPEISIAFVRQWLSQQKSYSLLKHTRKKFKRNRVLVSALNEEFQADLLDVSNLSTANKNIKFLLTVIDVLSKYAFAIPLKSKSAASTSVAFRQIFDERVPYMVHTDDGKEFKGSVQSLFKEYGIVHVVAKDANIKCSVAERFNKTLRLKIARYLTSNGKKKYIDVLPNIMTAYNNSVHSSIGMKPIDVTIENQKEAFNKLYGGKSFREMLLENFRKKSVLEVDDFVRIQLTKKKFSRGYHEQWSRILFRIVEVFRTGEQLRFSVKDATETMLPRKYYQMELQKIVPLTYDVEVLESRRRNGRTEFKVRYNGTTDFVWIPNLNVWHDGPITE